MLFWKKKNKEESKKITEQLYERGFELAVKNKTLALLEKLYQTSVLTLNPQEASKKITEIIQKDLSLEFAGIMALDKKSDTLLPLSFSSSQKLLDVLRKENLRFDDISIKSFSKNTFFEKLFKDGHAFADDPNNIWRDIISEENFSKIKKEVNLVMIVAYPLTIGGDEKGVFFMGMNRDYESLSTFEKEAIKSFINPVSLLLYKAYLYKNLQAAYEVEKRAHAVEKKAKDELEQFNEVKDQFLMVTQHNLRSPLTAMMGYAELLLDGDFGKLSKKTIEAVKKIQILAKSMKRMADDFLDVAKFQLGKEVVSLNPGVEVSSIVSEIVDELKFAAESKNIYLNFEKQENIPSIKADKEKLKAALFNIIDNAMKYTEEGGVTVKISNSQLPISNEMSKIKYQKSNIKNNNEQIPNSKLQITNSVVVEVKDTGIGIPEDKVSGLFDSQFKRGKEAQRSFAGGHGIGLYLSGKIIQAHKGRVWAESEGEGKGSTFFVELPQ